MSEIDERVVEMRFDNKEFEKNVQTSITTLDKLKAALKLEGSTKGLDELQKSANNFNMSSLIEAVNNVNDRFDALGVIGTTALVNITNKAISAGEALIKSLSIDNIALGWDKFADKTTAIGTLIGQGYDMHVVEDQMQRLNWFTDETSYNFVDMVGNISKFTATGKDLEESVSAMEGIALWAAASGQNATKASMAMYQLSQAMSKGVLKYDDWKSIQNASMDSKEFREQAIESAKALGIVKETVEGLYDIIGGESGLTLGEMFSTQGLSKGKWFTDEVMMDVFQKYNAASDAIRNYVLEQQELGNYITSSQAIEELRELGTELDENAIKWFEAGMEARTFKDVIDATKDAVSTGWMNTFQLIFGNYKEATEMWTNLCQTLYEIFAEGGNARNTMLAWWKDLGGRTGLLDALSLAFQNISEVVGTAVDAFHEFFTDDPIARGDFLLDMTGNLLAIGEGMKFTDGALQSVHDLFAGLSSVVRLVVDGFFALLEVLSPLLTPLNLLAGYILEALGAIGNLLTSFTESIRMSDSVAEAYDFITNTVINISDALTIAINIIAKFIKSFDPIRTVINGVKTLLKNITTVFSVIKSSILSSKAFNTVVSVLMYALYGLISVIAMVGTRIRSMFESGEMSEGLSRLLAILGDAASRISSIFDMLAAKLAPIFINMTNSVIAFFAQLTGGFEEAGKADFLDILAIAIGGVIGVFELAGQAVGGFIDYITKAAPPVGIVANTLSNATSGITELTGAVTGLTSTGNGLNDVKTKFSSFFSTILAFTSQIDFVKLALIGFAASSAYMMWEIGRAMSSVAGMAKSFATIPNIINKALKGYFKNTPAKIFLDVSVSIALLAGSLALLASVDSGKLKTAAAVLMILAAGVTAIAGAIFAIGLFDFDKDFRKNTLGIVSLAGSMFILAAALAILEKIEFNHLIKSMLILAAFGAAMVVASKFLSIGAEASLKPAISLLLFAAAFRLVIDAFNKLTTTIKPEAVQDAMNTLVMLVVGIMAISFAAGQLNIGSAAGLLVICFVLSSVMDAVKLLSDSKVNSNVLLGIFLTVIGLIALFALIGKFLKTTNGLSVGANIIINIVPTLLSVFGAIYLLVLSLDKLKKMNLGANGKTAAAVIGLISIIGLLIGLMFMMQFIPDPGPTLSITAVAIGAGIWLLANALLKISQISKEVDPLQVAAFFIGISVCMGALLVASSYTGMAKPSVILSMAAIIGVIAGVVALLSYVVDLDKAISVSFGLALVFAGLGFTFKGIANASKEISTGTAFAFMGIVGFLSAAIIALAVVPVEQAKMATIGMVAIMFMAAVVIGAFASAAKDAKDAKDGAIALLVTSLALIPAAAALAIIANYDFSHLGGAALALAGCMIALAAASQYMEPAMDVATTLLVMSGSLVLAALALKTIADIDSDSLIKAGIALIAVLGAFVALGFIATTPIGLGLYGFAMALVIFAAALLGIAAAAFLFAEAVSVIVAAIQALSAMSTEELMQLSENLPIVMAALGEGLAEGVFALLSTMLTKVGEVAGAFIVTVLQRGPEFISAGTELIKNFIIGMISASGKIITSTIEILTNLANAIHALQELFRSLGIFIITKLIEGLISVGGILLNSFMYVVNQILEVRAKIRQAFVNIGNNIVLGIADGILACFNYMQDVVEKFTDEGIVGVFKKVLGIASPSWLFTLLGMFIPEGAGDGITAGTPYAISATDYLGSSILTEAESYLSTDNGYAIGGNFANSIGDGVFNGIGNVLEQLKSKYPELLNGDGLLAGPGAMYEEYAANRKKREQERAALSDQQKLEKEMGWNQRRGLAQELQAKEFEKMITPPVGGGGGGGGGSAAKEAKETEKVIDEFTNILDYASESVGIFNTHWAMTTDFLGDTDSFDASCDALELLALQLYQTGLEAETADDKAKRMAKSQAEIMEDIKKSFVSVREEFEKTLDGQIDMFKMFDFGESVKSGDMVERFASNIRAIKDYSKMLEALAERGIDDGLLQNFAKKGPQALGEMKAFIQATDEEFAEMNRMWRDQDRLVKEAGNRYMSTLAYAMQGGEAGFEHVLDPETGEDTGKTYMEATLAGMRESLGVNLQEFQSIGEAVKEAITDGMTEFAEEGADTSDVAEALVDGVTDSIEDVIKSSNSEAIGKSLCEGLAKGIKENASLAINAAIEMATSALEAAKKALEINSPSKAFEDLGYYSDQGLANGFSKYGTIIRDAAAGAALGAVDEMSGVFGRIADLVDGTIDFDPTIRPVLDLTNLQYGADRIGSLLGLGDPYALNAVGMLSGIQNGADLTAQLATDIRDALATLKGQAGDQQPINIYIYPTAGQNEEQIANYVAWKLNHDVFKRRAVYGGT